MATRSTAPRRGESLVDENGVTQEQPQAFFDELARILNGELIDLTALTIRVTANEVAIAELEPQYVTIDSTDSPYAAANNDYITVDMSLGSVVVTLPASGRLSVSRDGLGYTLTLTGTVNGVVNPTINFDDTTLSLAFVTTEWRIV